MVTRLRYSLAVLAAVLATTPAAAASPQPHVLRVGSWKGIAGKYRTIQSAVKAARPGDWILVGPGDWRGVQVGKAGVYITTPRIHLRGIDRNAVIVDGTNAGPPCSSKPAAQTITSDGLNGIEVYKASGVSIENLTVCNWVGKIIGIGRTLSGNQIWFNGGVGSGQIGMHGYTGRYLTATSTYFKDTNSKMAVFGLLTSNADGPGLWQHVYSSNMGLMAISLRACPDCHAIIDDAHATHSELGFTAQNAGGHLVIQHSEFDHNLDGVALQSENGVDAPSPQDGACHSGATSLLAVPTSCTVIWHNHIHDNNDTATPRFGFTGPPPGIGVLDSAGNNDTIRDNLVENNGAWGVIVNDFPDFIDSAEAHCAGAKAVGPPDGSILCYFQAVGNQVLDNHLEHNGFFGKPGNGDLASATTSVMPGNCFNGNTDPGGITSDPPLIQTFDGTCGGPTPATGDLLTAMGLACGGQVLQQGGGPVCSVPNLTDYPPLSPPTMPAVLAQPTMPDPCAGVPANPWC